MTEEYVDNDGFVYDEKVHIVRPIAEEDKVYLLEQIHLILEEKENELCFIEEGSESEVYRYKNYAIKIQQVGLLKDGQILSWIKNNSLFPTLYMYGMSFMISEYISGVSFLYLDDDPSSYRDIHFARKEFKKATKSLQQVLKLGIIPFDCEPRNFILEQGTGRIKMIDVGDFRKAQKNMDVVGYAKLYFEIEQKILELKAIKKKIKKPNST